jgi:predicted nucleic acid-binding protein
MVLIDTSIWIDYFKGKESALLLNELIDSNDVCVNDLILAELIPSIEQRKEHDLKDMLYSITTLTIDIDWHEIIQMQIKNLQSGINNVGIPDLIIVQNIVENDVKILSSDRHFDLMSTIHGFDLYRK